MSKKSLLLVLIILLLSLLAACGGSNEENAANNTTNQAPAAEPAPANDEPAADAPEEPPAEPAIVEQATDEPTAEPVVEEEPTAEEPNEEIEEIDVAAIAGELDFNTYYYFFSMSATTRNSNDEETVQTISADIKFSVDPPANSFVLNMEGFEEEMGDMGGLGEISLIQIDNTTYTTFPGFGCITAPATSENPFADFNDSFSPDSLLEELDVSQVRRVRPNETINGFEVRHYTFDEELLNAGATPGQEYENAEGHIYLAEDGGFLVKMEMNLEGSGINLFGEENENENQASSFEYELVSVNEALDIAIPAACEEAASGANYPMPPDAFEVTSFGNILNFQSEMSCGRSCCILRLGASGLRLHQK